MSFIGLLLLFNACVFATSLSEGTQSEEQPTNSNESILLDEGTQSEEQPTNSNESILLDEGTQSEEQPTNSK